MTPKERAAIQQALEALEVSTDWDVGAKGKQLQSMKAITALRKALAEQAEQEPVAWALSHSFGLEFSSKYPMQTTKEAAEQMARQHMGAVVVTPLYAAPIPVTTPDVCGEVCARAKLCYGCNKDLEEANSKLAEQAGQEPVAWTATRLWNRKDTWKCPADIEKDLLYAAPVRTKDLTDEEIEWLVVDTLETWNSKDTMKDFARAVIAADREKNK